MKHLGAVLACLLIVGVFYLVKWHGMLARLHQETLNVADATRQRDDLQTALDVELPELRKRLKAQQKATSADQSPGKSVATLRSHLRRLAAQTGVTLGETSQSKVSIPELAPSPPQYSGVPDDPMNPVGLKVHLSGPKTAVLAFLDKVLTGPCYLAEVRLEPAGGNLAGFVVVAAMVGPPQIPKWATPP